MTSTSSLNQAMQSDMPAAHHTFLSDAIHRFVKNKLAILGCIIVILIIATAIFANWIAPLPYDKVRFAKAWLFPSAENLMGTDGLGRDFFSRIVYGAQTALLVGIVSQVLACFIGIPLGMVAGLNGGKVDFIIMRIVDVAWGLPRMLFAVLIMSLLGAGLTNLLFAIAITGWVPICRLSRALILQEKEKEYISAAKSIGVKDIHILLRHILPNILAPIVVTLTLGIPDSIFAEAGLSFLGLGVNPPTPSWGQMVGESINYIRHFWHLALFPSLMIAITMFGFTLVGDGLRDALDVQMGNF